MGTAHLSEFSDTQLLFQDAVFRRSVYRRRYVASRERRSDAEVVFAEFGALRIERPPVLGHEVSFAQAVFDLLRLQFRTPINHARTFREISNSSV